MSLLEIENLCVDFPNQGNQGKKTLRAVDQVSFTIDEGKSHILVGESGCGKSLTALAINGLLPKAARLAGGSVSFQGRELAGLPNIEMRKIRGRDISMVFQEPMTSLNPVITIYDQIDEVIRLHHPSENSTNRITEVLTQMGFEEPLEVARKYPHELSGGMRQRVVIAMAIACRPKLLIADEPTTALDVTVQAQILQLIKKIQSDLGLAVLLITHNLGIVSTVGDTMSVLYAGQVVESGKVSDVFSDACHPYTKALFATLPTGHKGKLPSIPGNVPGLDQFESLGSCRFYQRCQFNDERCAQIPKATDHYANCPRHPQ